MAAQNDLVLTITANADRLRQALQRAADDVQRGAEQMRQRLGPLKQGFAQTGAAAAALGAQASALTGQLGTTAAAAAGLAAGMGPLVGGVGAAIVGLGGLLTASAGAARRFSEIEDAAVAAGLTLEAYQEFEFIGRRFGVTVQGMADAMRELNVRATEVARQGTGDMAEGLERIGLSADELEPLLNDTAALFEEVIERTAQLRTAGDRALTLDQIFGEEGGRELIRLLDAGADGFDRLRKEAHQMGVVFDRDVIRQAAEASRQLEAMQFIIAQHLSGALVDLAPILVDLAEGFARVSRGVADFVGQFRSIDRLSSRQLREQVEAVRAELETRSDRDTAPLGDPEGVRRSWVDSMLSGAALGAGTGAVTGAVAGSIMGPMAPFIATLGAVGGATVGGVRGALQSSLKDVPTGDLRAFLDKAEANLEYLQADAGTKTLAPQSIRSADAIDSETNALERFLEAQREALEEAQFEVQILDRTNRERAVARALREAEAAALDAYANGLRATADLTAEERDEVRRLAVTQFEANQKLEESIRIRGLGSGALDEYNDKLRAAVEAAEFEASIVNLSNREQEIARALRETQSAAAKDYADGLRTAIELTESERAAISAAASARFDYLEAVRKTTDAVRDFIIGLHDLANDAEFERRISTLTEAEQELARAIRDAEVVARQEAVEGRRESAELTKEEIDALTEEVQRRMEATEALDDYRRAQQAVAEATEESRRRMEDMAQSIDNSIGQAFEDVLNGAKSWSEALISIVAHTVQLVADEMQRINREQGGPSLGAFIAESLSGLFRNSNVILPSGSPVPIPPPLPPGRSVGGRVKAGSPYIVGESGSELFVPDVNGQVLSRFDTIRAMTPVAPQFIMPPSPFEVPDVRPEVNVPVDVVVVMPDGSKQQADIHTSELDGRILIEAVVREAIGNGVADAPMRARYGLTPRLRGD